MNRLLTIVDSKYQRLEYLESTGTQYIDTGIKPTNATTIKLKTIAFNKNVFIYGCRPNSSANNKHAWNFSDVGSFYPQFGSDGIGISYSWSTQAIYEIENGQNGAYVNGVKIKTYSEATFNSTLNMFLFGINENGSLENRTLKGRIYYFQVYEGTTLVRNFVPVLRKTDNELGMLDLVEGKFYPNAGTGKFTANLDTMYAIIQGSPTQSPYGVFSGFSASNYLKLQQQFQPADKNWEIVVKTNITELNVIQTIIGSSSNTKNIQLSIRDTNILRFYRTTDGDNDIVNNSTLTIDSIGVYFFKISFNGSQYKISVSQNGNDYTDYISINNSTPIYNNSPQLALGYNGRNTAEYFRNSIDLPNSYIKLGSTKYNLQAVVGYTIVGSPTIVDGVVSGFSNSNYLQINSGISVGQNFEIYTKFTTGASLSSNQELMVGKISSDFYLRIFIQNGATLFTSTRVVGASSISHNQTSYSFQTNTTYFVKVKYDGANKLDVFIYDNTGQQVKTNSFTLSNQINTFNSLLIGTVGTPSSVWGGSIDLNETYIKINNKLWFNGQQA